MQLAETEECLAREQRETARLTEELSSSAAGEEVNKLKYELKHERERAKQAWHLSCAQVTKQENFLAKREDKIAELKRKLRVSLHDDSIRSHSSESESESHDLSPDVRMEHVRRRGKAPPVDTFTGEDADFRFDDWLLALQRAASWNCWSDEDPISGSLSWTSLAGMEPVRQR